MNVQLATSFANRLAPYGLGGTAVNERYLERCGLPRTTAIAVTALTVTFLLGGQVGANIAYIAALGFSVHAFGATASAALVAAVFLGGQALGAASPTPAGLGVVEAYLVAGLMVGGVPSTPAVAGVLAYRLATFWLPAAVGFFSLRTLQRHHIL
ncbi:lysylphosphatidylglycerol synthase domain-containing protein [Nocardia sp. NPDC051787]|uniref:lysylphosphatidylglycerol synthase domain-containing protein n=1 Tax=Nocardia sp. NPDC051787 TaxID=3155415 RepID=UPI0034284068